jgi:hypothetical protein
MDKCISALHLARWLEGSLGDADTETVSKHLSTCDDCRRSVGLAYVVEETPALSLSPVEHARALAAVLGPGTLCANVDLWSRWVEETLTEAEREKVNHHMADCDDCRRTVALSRLTAESHAPSLSDTARRKLLNLVAPVKRVAWVWRVAAAAVVVVGVMLYFALRPPAVNPSVVKTNEAPSTTAIVKDAPKEPAPVVPKPPEPAPEPEPRKPAPIPPPKDVPKIVHKQPDPVTPVPVPVPSKVRPTDPALFARVAVSDVTGPLSLRRAGSAKASPFGATDSLGFGDELIAEQPAAVTIDGAALVMLEKSARVSLMASASGPSYAMLIHAGAAFIDTVGTQQAWEVWYNDDTVTLTKMNGRVAVDASRGALSVGVVTGAALVGSQAVKAGTCVTVTGRGLESAPLAESVAARVAAAKPERVTLFSVQFGSTVTGASVKSGRLVEKDPGYLEAGTGGPAKNDTMIWAGFRLPKPVVYGTGLFLRVRYRSSAGAMVLHAEGFERPLGRHGVTADWIEQDFQLHGLQKNEGDLEYGSELQTFHVGCLRGERLEIDWVKVIRFVE